MSDLQEMALAEAKELIRSAYMDLSKEATNPAHFAKTDTFTYSLYAKLSKAESWIRAVEEAEGE